MKMNLDFDGRKVVKNDVNEIQPGKIVMTSELNDGTVIKFTQVAQEITVDCNKTLELQSDGTTLKIID